MGDRQSPASGHSQPSSPNPRDSEDSLSLTAILSALVEQDRQARSRDEAARAEQRARDEDLRRTQAEIVSILRDLRDRSVSRERYSDTPSQDTLALSSIVEDPPEVIPQASEAPVPAAPATAAPVSGMPAVHHHLPATPAARGSPPLYAESALAAAGSGAEDLQWEDPGPRYRQPARETDPQSARPASWADQEVRRLMLRWEPSLHPDHHLRGVDNFISWKRRITIDLSCLDITSANMAQLEPIHSRHLARKVKLAMKPEVRDVAHGYIELWELMAGITEAYGGDPGQMLQTQLSAYHNFEWLEHENPPQMLARFDEVISSLEDLGVYHHIEDRLVVLTRVARTRYPRIDEAGLIDWVARDGQEAYERFRLTILHTWQTRMALQKRALPPGHPRRRLDR